MKDEPLIRFFLSATRDVMDAGYSEEIFWAQDVDFNKVNERIFLSEAAHVIFNSGFRASVIRMKWPAIRTVFFDFGSAKRIVEHSRWCYEEALKVFGHKGKVNAVIEIATDVYDVGFDSVKKNIEEHGPEWLIRYRFIGKITCFHLARNLGLDFVKPDVHLVRIAEACGYDEPKNMCQVISEATGDRLGVVDAILWRWAESYPRRHEGKYWVQIEEMSKEMSDE